MGYRKRGIDGLELLAWIKSQCIVDDHGCWLWQGPTNDKGYGVTNYNKIHTKAHQLTYRLQIGPVPEGLELDHTCRVRKCCNPLHMEAITHAENVKRGLLHTVSGNKPKPTSCPKGHPYEGYNLYFDPKGGMRCRQCGNEKNLARYHKAKTEINAYTMNAVVKAGMTALGAPINTPEISLDKPVTTP